MKWIALSKKQPSFDQKVVFTDVDSLKPVDAFDFWVGSLADITETKTGKLFMTYDESNEQERRSATHWMVPDEPKIDS